VVVLCVVMCSFVSSFRVLFCLVLTCDRLALSCVVVLCCVVLRCVAFSYLSVVGIERHGWNRKTRMVSSDAIIKKGRLINKVGECICGLWLKNLTFEVHCVLHELPVLF
jgi:hypothetical protein